MSNLPNFPTIRPSLLLDFANSKQVDPRISFTRASTATYYDAQGVLRTAASGVPRIDHDPATGECKGLLIEEQRTNSIPNNTMQGVAAGVPGTTPTGWSVTSTANGITREIVGSGTEAGISYLDVKFSGTPATTGNASVGFVGSTAISVSAGQAWTGTAFIRLVAGSLTNTSPTLSLLETDTGGAGVGENSVAISPTAAALSLQRYAMTTTIDAAGAAHLLPRVRIGYTVDAPIDFTLRIGMPQCELGAFATSVIPTTTAAATRAADAASMSGTNFSEWYRQDEGTLVVEGSTSDLSASRGLWAIGDPTLAFGSRNSIYSAINATSGGWLVSQAVNGVSQINTSAVTGNFSAGVARRTAYAYKSNDSVGSNNGAIGTPDNLCDVPYTANFGLSIGNLNNGWSAGATYLNGHIKLIAYYSKRLTNAELQALTA